MSSGQRKDDEEIWWWNEEVEKSIQRKQLARKKWECENSRESTGIQEDENYLTGSWKDLSKMK